MKCPKKKLRESFIQMSYFSYINAFDLFPFSKRNKFEAVWCTNVLYLVFVRRPSYLLFNIRLLKSLLDYFPYKFISSERHAGVYEYACFRPEIIQRPHSGNNLADFQVWTIPASVFQIKFRPNWGLDPANLVVVHWDWIVHNYHSIWWLHQFMHSLAAQKFEWYILGYFLLEEKKRVV